MIINHKFYVGLRDINNNLELTNTGILACLEDVACMHSEIAGYGVFDREKTRKTWLLLNWKVEIVKRPLFNEVITVQTWSRGMEKFYAYRDFKVFDENNNILIKGTSKWVFIDIDKKKPVKILDEVDKAYHPENIFAFESNSLDKLVSPENYNSVTSFKITKNMIDINNHLHNIYYMDIAEEALPNELGNSKNINNFEIMYKKEIKLGDTVKAFYSNNNNEHFVVIKNEDEKILHAIVKFKTNL